MLFPSRVARLSAVRLFFIGILWATMGAGAVETEHRNSGLPAFPGAEGFGRYARGGRGGDVYYVTSLEDAGPGTLRDAIRSADGPRTVLFAVSGTISLKSALVVDKPYITIAGQTAPGDGITLRDHELRIFADHVIVRYLRSRLGDRLGHSASAIRIGAGRDIILDHVSASWGINETLSTSSPAYPNVQASEAGDIDRITIQWCLIAEGLYASHPFQGKTRRAYGGVIRSRRESLHHNLYAHHNWRSPKVAWRAHSQVDFRNNVIYNAPSRANHDGANSYVNWVDNYYKPGPNTGTPDRYVIYEIWNRAPDPRTARLSDHHDKTPQFFIRGNFVEGYPEISADNWSGVTYSQGASVSEVRVDVPHDYPWLAEERTAEEAYPAVLESAGASMVRDAIDQRIVREVRSGAATYGGVRGAGSGIIDSQDDVGGWPELRTERLPDWIDTNGNGLPDWWTRARGLNPDDGQIAQLDGTGNGYTYLEEYINDLEAIRNTHRKARQGQAQPADR